MWWVQTFPHRLSAFIAVIYAPEFSPFHWLTGEVTDRPPPPPSADGRCGDLIQSEPLTHVPPHPATSGDSIVLLCVFVLKHSWNAWLGSFMWDCSVLCTWGGGAVFATLEHLNIIVTTVKSGNPESDVIREHLDVPDSTPRFILDVCPLSSRLK